MSGIWAKVYKEELNRQCRSRVASRKLIIALADGGCLAVARRSEIEGVRTNRHAVQRIAHLARSGADGIPCSEIGERMITRDPDVTRLLDRLQKRGLVERSRGKQDRRVIYGKLPPPG